MSDKAFGEIVSHFNGREEITLGTGFGANPGLRVDGKIFAMLNSGELVVKLPRERVDALVHDGWGKHFRPRAGRAMKEWAAVTPQHHAEWPELADEAFAFVSGTE